MVNYFMYARKSSDAEERQALSIDAQLSELREFAAKESLSVVQEFIETRTAEEPGRPVFNEMVKLVDAGEAEGIIAWHPDRLARNSVDGGLVVHFLSTGKLQALRFPTFWFENTPQGKFVLNMAFGQSQYYRRQPLGKRPARSSREASSWRVPWLGSRGLRQQSA